MVRFEDSCALQGQLCYAVRRRGKAIEEFNDGNMVMTAGRVAIARLFAGSAGGHGYYVGVGDGGDPPNPEQEGLTNQRLVKAWKVGHAAATVEDGIAKWVESAEPTPNVRLDFLLGESDANGLSIREFGLLTFDGALFARRTRPGGKAIEKDQDLTIEGYWIIRF
jgi:hypothetical protein